MVNKNERPDVSTGQGGNYTIATDPPKVWVPLEFDDNISKAHQFVEDVKEKLDNVSALEDPGLTVIDNNSSEQDVIKLFNLFIMYPVEIALLQIELPEHFKLKIRCEVHPDKGRAVRVDIILEACSTSSSLGIKTLAIMEMKNFGVITDEMGRIMDCCSFLGCLSSQDVMCFLGSIFRIDEQAGQPVSI
ncbi:uncharacterized protein LY89DRAFT_773875 [Mollisia scopiformis]|uniref:Uncharacterized protein n=1 Tax=Mollisia scopiformis TaxID=149040 RepID=A0A194XGV1_MOLSC|nr:uncharacterized protein LY89DRAFT_773875 [Mollisia scopiformis]KUJ19425.1 hypothetical protein LY89DRAFT_773875 [Mollisia scopiformis]